MSMHADGDDPQLHLAGAGAVPREPARADRSRPAVSQTAPDPWTIAIEWNQTARDYPRDCTVHELFEAQARTRPLSVALISEQGEVTYAELNRRANKLAHWLRGHGLRPGAVAALCLPRGLELVAAVLAVLKVGAAYLPLDLADPRQRLASLLTEARPAALLTTVRLQRRLSELVVETIALDDTFVAAEISAAADHDPCVPVAPDTLCYVMVTSGSTGSPKGVMVPHRAVVRLVHGTDFVEFGPRRTFMQLAPTCFDASTFELWGPCCTAPSSYWRPRVRPIRTRLPRSSNDIRFVHFGSPRGFSICSLRSAHGCFIAWSN